MTLGDVKPSQKRALDEVEGFREFIVIEDSDAEELPEYSPKKRKTGRGKAKSTPSPSMRSLRSQKEKITDFLKK